MLWRVYLSVSGMTHRAPTWCVAHTQQNVLDGKMEQLEKWGGGKRREGGEL